MENEHGQLGEAIPPFLGGASPREGAAPRRVRRGVHARGLGALQQVAARVAGRQRRGQLCRQSLVQTCAQAT
eukprot:8683405-Pyramimonas_sp.AAC.1